MSIKFFSTPWYRCTLISIGDYTPRKKTAKLAYKECFSITSYNYWYILMISRIRVSSLWVIFCALVLFEWATSSCVLWGMSFLTSLWQILVCRIYEAIAPTFNMMSFTKIKIWLDLKFDTLEFRHFIALFFEIGTNLPSLMYLWWSWAPPVPGA